MSQITNNNLKIGLDNPPFIIAEMSGNHNQSLDRALEIVEAAASTGAHALKLQTYTADTLTLDINKGEFFISDENSLWKGQSLYELFKQAYTPWEWHKPIMLKAKELGMLCFSSPFDNSAVNFLEELNVPAYKIASSEIIHLPLIKKVASTGKPLIISTGMASISEINEAVLAAREYGCGQLTLLKCTSSYPASPSEINLNTISHMRDLFECEVGLSDHTLGIGTAIAAVALSATVIEKHFTLSRAAGGTDSAFSMEPNEMTNLVKETERAWKSLGKIKYGPTKSEQANLKHRQSLYITHDMKAGEVLTPDNLRSIRPGLGLPPKYYEMLLGRKIKCNVSEGTATSWELLFE
jgi:pseudaminic acid synthase